MRDPKLNLYQRRRRLWNAIRLYCYFVGRPLYTAIRSLLDARFGFDSQSPLTQESLLGAIVTMEVVRNQVVELRRAFERKRIKEKARGKRHSSLDEALLREAMLKVQHAAGLLPLDQK